jgi:imidazolonepropionase-like amidohydrolase
MKLEQEGRNSKAGVNYLWQLAMTSHLLNSVSTMNLSRSAARTRVAVLLGVVGIAVLTTCRMANATDTLSPITAYVGAFVLNSSGDRFDPNVTILVRGAKISAVGPGGSFAVPPDARMVRLNGRYIIPGLVNSHVHIATLAIPRDARAYLRRELYSGVTMVRDMAGDVRLIAELKREAAQDEIVAPDIYYAALMAGDSFFVDPRTHAASRGVELGTAPWMRAITATTDLRRAVAEAKGTGATAIKLYADLPASLVASITTEAHRQQMLVWAHAAIFPARPSDVVDAGVDVMSHADFLAFESVTPFPETFQVAKLTNLSHWQMTPAIDSVLTKMKDRGIILDATVNVGFQDPLPQWPSTIAPQLAHEAYRRGIKISAGTDDDADWNDPRSALLTEIERLVHDVGMSTADALRSATIIGAETIGEQDSAGILAEGRAANFVVLRANPLSDIHNLHGVVLVVKHGVPHMRSAYRPVTASDMASRSP